MSTVIIVVLALVSLVLFILLRLSNRQVVVLTGRNLLYKEFVDNCSIKKFLKLIDTVHIESLDLEIRVLLEKYIKKVFLKLKSSNFTLLIKDVESSKRSDIIMYALITVTRADDTFLLGDALSEAIKDCNNEQEEILNNFLKKLPFDIQKNELKYVVERLNKYLDIELGDHVVSEIRTAMEAARTRIQKRIEFIK